MTATHDVTHEVAGTNGAGHGDAVGPDALVERLRSQATRYHSEHDFHVRMNAGELSPAQIRGWVANRFCYQEAIPRKDAAILGNCPDREIRQRWIRRITDHDGTWRVRATEGGIEAWLRLGEAVGLDRAELLDGRHIVPGVRFSVDAYVVFARTRPWLEAVASSLTELFAPGLMAERLAAFEKHYTWIDRDGLDYFRNRLHQAPRDSEHALEIVTAALPHGRAAGRRRRRARVQERRALGDDGRHRPGLPGDRATADRHRPAHRPARARPVRQDALRQGAGPSGAARPGDGRRRSTPPAPTSSVSATGRVASPTSSTSSAGATTASSTTR